MKSHTERLKDCKRMGFTLFILAFLFCFAAYLTPTDESSLWFSSSNKEGAYAISGFMLVLSIYCYGAVRYYNKSIC